MKNGKRLAFDYGSVRIGVAASDSSGILVSPLDVLINNEKLDANLLEILTEIRPIYIAVGIPNMLSGKDGTSQAAVLEFVSLLKNNSAAQIYGIDERLSTVSAAAKLRESGKNAKSSKDLIDSAAAVGILEMAMEFERVGGLDKCAL